MAINQWVILGVSFAHFATLSLFGADEPSKKVSTVTAVTEGLNKIKSATMESATNVITTGYSNIKEEVNKVKRGAHYTGKRAKLLGETLVNSAYEYFFVKPLSALVVVGEVAQSIRDPYDKMVGGLVDRYFGSNEEGTSSAMPIEQADAAHSSVAAPAADFFGSGSETNKFSEVR